MIPNVRILVSPSADLWVAECVEFDLVATADSLDELRHETELMFTSRLQICQAMAIDPWGIDPPPEDVRTKWEAGVQPSLAGWPAWAQARLARP